jgi:hypothetical protein
MVEGGWLRVVADQGAYSASKIEGWLQLQLQLPFPVRAKLDEKGNGKRDHLLLIPVSMPKR